MFGFHVRLGLKSLKRNPVLTALMIGAIGLGVGVCLTTLNVYYLVSGNPIRSKNDVLFAVQLDSWDPADPWDDENPARPPPELTHRDATAVLASEIPARSVVMHKGAFVLAPGEEDSEVKPYIVELRLTPGDFFAMFNTPFKYGSGWDERADANGDAVIVLSKDTNDKVFGGEDSVGRSIKLDDREYRVVGVLDEWTPVPKFYDLNNGAFDEIEEGFIPFSRSEMLEVSSAGNTNCWKPESINSYREFLTSECVWIQAWVELPTAAKVAEFQSWLDSYVGEQKKLGRFQRPLNNRLTRPDEWLQVNEVVSDDNRVLLGISFMFLAVCLLNTVGLLLAKFSGAAAVISLHRALGASRALIFRQHMIEVSIVGIAGGVLGVALGYLGLIGLRQLYNGYEEVTRLHWDVAIVSLCMALIAGVLAGLYPTWRIMRLQPAPYLKTQ
ncbi:MAG: FtsX-like permease family protein [Gammaproteobacteria bacterium]|nr:FtsX-like permease family protein [Gammaproteobacteria bacterium]